MTIEQIAADFGIHPMMLSKWMSQADVDGGVRKASFTPRLVLEGQRRIGGLDDMIISLYAGRKTGRVGKFPDELRERAVGMVAEVWPDCPSQWAAITAVAGVLGIWNPGDAADLDPPRGG